MFYQDEHDYDNDLRFGDVIKLDGLASVIPIFNNLNPETTINDYTLDITKQPLCVVITPCCSIGLNTIILTPLIQVQKGFYKNQYYCEDLTRINRQMTARQSISDIDLAEITDPIEREARLNEPVGYALLENLIYEPHEKLPTYPLRVKMPNSNREDITVGHYMIDLRKNFRINSNTIVYDEDSGCNDIGNLKLLELSVDTRKEFREKISWYYFKPTKEDEMLL